MVRRRAFVSPFMWLCLMGGFAIFSTTMSKNPALPLFIKSLGVGEAALGFIAAASTVVGVVVSLPAGLLSDIWGRRRVILLSMVVFATAPFLYLLVAEPWHLVLVRIYHGFATAILGPVAMATVADTFQEGRGERMAWYSSATMVGRFLAPSFGGLLIIGNDFRWVYLGCGAAGILALASALQLPQASEQAPSKARPRTRPRTSGHSLATEWQGMRQELAFVATNLGVLTVSLTEAAQYFAFGSVETFLPLYLKGLGWEAKAIGLLFTTQIVVATLTKPVMGRLSDRWGRKLALILGLAVGGLSISLMPWVVSWPLIGALMALFGLGLATVTAATAALVSDLSRAAAYGTSLGVMSSVMDVGHSTGPMVTGLVVAAIGYRSGFGIVAAVLIAFAALIAVLVREPGSAH